MLFIVSSDVEKADPATRKLIRSHAMQGIKKQRRRRLLNVQATVNDPSSSAKAVLEAEIGAYASGIPRCIGSDLSFVECVHGVEPSMLLNIVKG